MLKAIHEEIPIAGVCLISVEQQVYELTSELAHGSFFGFMEVYSGGDFRNVDGLAGNAELVRFAAILPSTAMATAVQSAFGSCEISEEIAAVGDGYVRGLATDLNEPFTIGTRRE